MERRGTIIITLCACVSQQFLQAAPGGVAGRNACAVAPASFKSTKLGSAPARRIGSRDALNPLPQPPRAARGASESTVPLKVDRGMIIDRLERRLRRLRMR